MDDVRVWNVARTQEQIVTDMERELAGDEPGLVGYWKFNGGSLEDATANGNDLTNQNGVTFTTDVPFTDAQTIDPVIIVPGILGSSQKDGEWIIDPILHTYDDLIATFDENGYEPGVDLFTFGYDWRESNVDTAQLLKQKIDEAKDICGCEKVDLVTHSMGGLVARQYIQSAAYGDDVDQLIFLGTPHRGAPKAYLMWEGGEFVTPSVFDRLTQRFLKGDARKNGYASTFEYLRGHQVAAVEELLPDYSYLFERGSLRTYPNRYPANDFLESLNAGVQTLLDSGVELHTFIGDEQETITGIDVVAPPRRSALWEHGYPKGFDNPRTDRGLILGMGDQTVPFFSASYVDEDLVVRDSPHNGLPEDAAGDIVALLRGESAATIVDDWSVPDIKVLMFQMFSPADMLVTDPAGKRVGTAETGDVNEIFGAFYAGPAEDREIITIPDPIPGTYTIEVRGTGTGDYTLESAFMTDEKEDSVARPGKTAPGQSTIHTLNLVPDVTDPLKIKATFASTIADLEYARAEGWIDAGTYSTTLAKLRSAQLVAGKSETGKRAILETILKDLERRRGKSVSPEVYELLSEDIRSLM